MMDKIVSPDSEVARRLKEIDGQLREKIQRGLTDEFQSGRQQIHDDILASLEELGNLSERASDVNEYAAIAASAEQWEKFLLVEFRELRRVPLAQPKRVEPTGNQEKQSNTKSMGYPGNGTSPPDGQEAVLQGLTTSLTCAADTLQSATDRAYRLVDVLLTESERSACDFIDLLRAFFADSPFNLRERSQAAANLLSRRSQGLVAVARALQKETREATSESRATLMDIGRANQRAARAMRDLLVRQAREATGRWGDQPSDRQGVDIGGTTNGATDSSSVRRSLRRTKESARVEVVHEALGGG